MLKIYNGNIKQLLNTSGQDYRKLNLKEQLPTLTHEDILKLLTTNGNLIKRPFFITQTSGIVGFKESEWKHFSQNAIQHT